MKKFTIFVKIISNLAILVKILYTKALINRLFILFMTKRNQGSFEKGLVPEHRRKMWKQAGTYCTKKQRTPKTNGAMSKDMEVSLEECPSNKPEYHNVIIVDCKTPRQIHESMEVLKEQ